MDESIKYSCSGCLKKGGKIKTRDGLLNYLRTCNLVQKDPLNGETIRGHLVKDFIRVSPLNPDSI